MLRLARLAPPLSSSTTAAAAASVAQLLVKPLKQKIQVGATAYELQEIYGIEGQAGGSDAAGGSDDFDDDGEGKSRECAAPVGPKTAPRKPTRSTSRPASPNASSYFGWRVVNA